MNWLRYLVEANLYLSIFYLCYCLFLNRETHYMLNRVYLLFTCVAAFIIPIIQLGVLKPAAQVYKNTIIILPGDTHQIINQRAKIIHEAVTHFTLQDYILFGYLFGAFILLLLLVFKLYQLLKLTHVKSVIVEGNYKLIYINDSNTAFSFFNYLFIGTKASGAATIIRHELVHIRQKHSFDIVLLELFKVINWFNPFVYLLQNSLKAVHEYIADENTTTAHTDILSYSTFLLNSAYGIGGSSITHSFFNYNLLKKRIIMLNQKRSGSLARLKYLATVPLCAGLLCVSTLGFSKTYGLIDLMPQKADTALIASPPPPEPPALKHAVKLPPPSSFGSITKKGYRYAEAGYLADSKSYFKVIIQESKSVQKEYWKSKVSAAEVKMLRDKYGYTFPSMDIFPKLLPPPPAPVSPVPPVKPKGPLSAKKLSPPVVIRDTAPGKPLLPPPPRDPFDTLYRFIGRKTGYPASARDNLISGRVIINFNIIDGKIEDVTMPRGLYPAIDAEAMRVINDFKAPLNVKSANYSVPIFFGIIDKAGNYVGGAPKTNNNSAATVPETKMAHYDISYTLNEVVVNSYL
ncbi:MAG: hypothetical protein JWQ63_2570 [Mucilaginibacter sp.]|nr:hypothetical protein [Mucilaginibacter sp.]